MKLSEAIQLGSMLRPQTFGPFADSCGTCAMGAALDAIGQKIFKTGKVNEKRIRKIWPWLTWRLKVKRCPWCGIRDDFTDVFYFIVHLNDEDRLPRQEIADLIATMEVKVRAQIDMLVPDYQTLRLGQLEANLPLPRKKRTSSRKGIIPQTTLTQG